MLEVVSWIIIGLISNLFYCYIFNRVSENNKKVLKFKIIITCFICAFINAYTVNYNVALKTIIINLSLVLILKACFEKTWVKTIFSELCIYLLFVVSELIFSIIVIGIFRVDITFLKENLIGICICNIGIYFITFLLSKSNILMLKIKKITDYYSENNYLNFIFKMIISSVTLSILFYPISQQSLEISDIVIKIIIFIGVLLFISGYFNEKSNNNKLTVEYGQLLEYVKDYEKEVVEKGKRQHEYKNQLIVINDMIPKNNKKLKQYVEDKLNVEKNLKDNIWLEKLTNLPSGGIKGLVYYKFKKMVENNIDVFIEIDNELSDKKKWFNVEKYLEDYTRILGVYLDNAIEAAIESKDKQIVIEFINNDNNIEFVLSNTYNGSINNKNIDKEKYSTKGKDRGYGLSLVKDIIDNNKLFNQTREINGKFYVQKLTIKK